MTKDNDGQIYSSDILKKQTKTKNTKTKKQPKNKVQNKTKQGKKRKARISEKYSFSILGLFIFVKFS